MIPDNELSTVPVPSVGIGPRDSAMYSDTVDRVHGGPSLYEYTEDLKQVIWTCEVRNDGVYLYSSGNPEIRLVESYFIKSISLAFDTNMNWYLAYEDSNGSWLTGNEFPTVLPIEGTEPKVILEDNRKEFKDNSEILVFYVRDRELFYLKSSTNFSTEDTLLTQVDNRKAYIDKLIRVSYGENCRINFEVNTTYTPYRCVFTLKQYNCLPESCHDINSTHLTYGHEVNKKYWGEVCSDCYFILDKTPTVIGVVFSGSGIKELHIKNNKDDLTLHIEEGNSYIEIRNEVVGIEDTLNKFYIVLRRYDHFSILTEYEDNIYEIYTQNTYTDLFIEGYNLITSLEKKTSKDKPAIKFLTSEEEFPEDFIFETLLNLCGNTVKEIDTRTIQLTSETYPVVPDPDSYTISLQDVELEIRDIVKDTESLDSYTMELSDIDMRIQDTVFTWVQAPESYTLELTDISLEISSVIIPTDTQKDIYTIEFEDIDLELTDVVVATGPYEDSYTIALTDIDLEIEDV